MTIKSRRNPTNIDRIHARKSVEVNTWRERIVSLEWQILQKERDIKKFKKLRREAFHASSIEAANSARASLDLTQTQRRILVNRRNYVFNLLTARTPWHVVRRRELELA